MNALLVIGLSFACGVVFGYAACLWRWCSAEEDGAQRERRFIVADLRLRGATKLPGVNDVVRSLALGAAADYYERGYHLQRGAEKAAN